MSFCWHEMVMSVSQTVILPTIVGMGAKLGEGMWAIDFQPSHSTNWLLTKWQGIKESSMVFMPMYLKLAGLLSKSPCSSSSLRCDVIHKYTIRLQFVALLKPHLDIQLTQLWWWFVEQKLLLGCNFWCDQIWNWQRYYCGHTLLGHLSQTHMFNT